MELIKVSNFIDGDFKDTQNNQSSSYFESFNPATKQVNALIPNSTEADVKMAVDAALVAFESWSRKTPSYRSKILLRISNLIQERLEEFALAESIDQGKPLSLARSIDIPRAIYNFEFFATAM